MCTSVEAASPVQFPAHPLRTLSGRAQSRRRCGQGEPSPWAGWAQSQHGRLAVSGATRSAFGAASRAFVSVRQAGQEPQPFQGNLDVVGKDARARLHTTQRNTEALARATPRGKGT